MRKPKQEEYAYGARIALWLNRDPIQEDGGINLYGMVYNDPANGVDPLGLAKWSKSKCDQLKKDIIDAYLAKGAYDGTPPPGYVLTKTTSDPETGYMMREFTSLNGKDRVVTFAGTNPTELGDLQADAVQAIGHPVGSQYDLARDYAQENPPPSRYVGHSLGGGLAHLAGNVSGVPVVTFNSAALHPNTLYFYGDIDSKVSVRNLVLKNDILTIFQKNYGAMNGIDYKSGAIEVYPNPSSYPKRFFHLSAYYSMQMHFMDNVISSLDELMKCHCL